MKKTRILFCLLGLAVLLAAPLLAQTTTVPVPFAGNDDTVKAILGFGGIGLVYVLNFVKNLLKLQDKQAVLLIIGVALAGTAIVLLFSHLFTIAAFLIYSFAVFGEMTAWYKVTWPAKKT